MNGGLQNIDNVVRSDDKPQEAKQDAPVAEEQANLAPTNSDRVLLTWNGSSFDYKEKGLRWYLALGIVVLGIIGYLAWQQDWFTIVITLIVTAVLVWYINTARPEEQEYSISTFGISISGHYYPFSEIHSFWMVYTPKVQKLYFVQSKKYLPSVIMDISGVSPEHVKQILARKIPEQPTRGENILDKMLRVLNI